MTRSIASQWSVGARSETGYVRNENQDRMSCVKAPFGSVYIVSDGMGGHRGGEFAAELTVKVLTQQLSCVDSTTSLHFEIKRAVEEANRVVYEQGHSGVIEVQGMGATVVVLLMVRAQAMVAHVGDSRAYMLRGGELRQLTKDHSRVQRMVDGGILTASDAMSHPDANVLERAIGVLPDVEVDISEWMPLQPDDRILLCSDGLHGYVPNEEIAAIFRAQAAPQELADQLVNLALQKGGEDNITVQVIGRFRRAGLSGIISRFTAVVVTMSVVFCRIDIRQGQKRTTFENIGSQL